MHDRIGRCGADQLRAQPQRSASARRLDRAQAARSESSVPLPQHQPPHRLVESRVTYRGDVRLRRLSRDQLALRFTDRPHHRSLPGIVAENANAQVHLARVWIDAKSSHHTEDGVRRQPVEMLEHTYLLTAQLRQEIEFTRCALWSGCRVRALPASES